MELTEKQQQVLEEDGNLLVSGGPGSGKTTVAILKAERIVEQELRPAQRVLFLSFARATVSRVLEAIQFEHNVSKQVRRRIEVETYHSFFWRIIRTHGYLVGLPRTLTLLAPPDEAVALSSIRTEFGADNSLTADELSEKRQREQEERMRLATEEGRICFDLFASFASQVLSASRRIRQLVALRFPTIIVDEFQDTNAEQWGIVQELGKHSRLIALADPEQRIYDWIGADPERLDHFRKAYEPADIDLAGHNHRSGETEILDFGNAVLTGEFKEGKYSGVTLLAYKGTRHQALSSLITTTYGARQRLIDSGAADWSLAILVPTKLMTRMVSDAFRTPPGNLTPISHTASIEMEGAILGAEVIAELLDPRAERLGEVVDALCNYYQGCRGDRPTQTNLRSAEQIRDAYEEYLERAAAGRAIRGNSVLARTIQTIEEVRLVALSGVPDADWRSVRQALSNGSCSRLRQVAEEVRNLRLLGRGLELRQRLSEVWREKGTYEGARAAVQAAFEREHFAVNRRPESGVVVMNMHKAKGKQFDEVIIFEGWPVGPTGNFHANRDRIVRSNLEENNSEQVRQNLRVSITRGRSHMTILTPVRDPCILLLA